MGEGVTGGEGGRRIETPYKYTTSKMSTGAVHGLGIDV